MNRSRSARTPGSGPRSSRSLWKVLHGDPILRLHIRHIDYDQEKPFQRFHQDVDPVGNIRRADHLRHRETVFIIDIPDPFVQARDALFHDLFECICHAELAVHDHRMPVPDSHADRFYYFSVAARGNGAEIVFIIINVLWGDLLGEIPVARLGPCADGTVRTLAEQQQDTDYDPKERPHKKKRCRRPDG